MSLSPRNAPQLYAVIDRGPRKRNIVEIRQKLNAELQTKAAIDRANQVLDRLECRIASYQSHIARLQRRVQLTLARHARLEDEIIGRLDTASLQHADGFERFFGTQLAPPAVQIDNEHLIPDAYMRQPKQPPKAPDKVAIKGALAEDENLEIPGVHLTRKTTLVRR